MAHTGTSYSRSPGEKDKSRPAKPPRHKVGKAVKITSCPRPIRQRGQTQLRVKSRATRTIESASTERVWLSRPSARPVLRQLHGRSPAESLLEKKWQAGP